MTIQPPADSPAAGPSTVTAAERAEAFATLGLDPAADGDLVELAYWQQIEICRAAYLGTPAWPARLAQLNRARQLLTVPMPPGARPAHRPPPPRGRRWPLALATPAPLIAAALFMAVTTRAGWGPERVGAGGLIVCVGTTALVAAGLGWALRRGAPVTFADPEPHRVLRVRPGVDPRLVALAYRHELRRARRTGDPQAVAAVERAYARLVAGGNGAGGDHRPAAPPAASGPEPDAAERPARPWRRRARALLRAGAGALRAAGRAGAGGARLGRRAAGAAVRLGRALVARAATARARPGPPPPYPAPEGRHDGPPARAAGARRGPARTAGSPPAGAFPRDVAGTVGALRVWLDGEELLRYALANARVYTIGAAPHCDVHLPVDPGSGEPAAEHARLSVRRGRVLFHHTAPTGTSTVNGDPTVWAVLEPGDTIGIGPYRCLYLADEEGKGDSRE
jgi:hypothetical protein